MHSDNNSVSCAENEEQLLRFLCASRDDVTQRRQLFQNLTQYSWRVNDHRILFEAIGELLARNSPNILEHLPAELTRRGFPDISCDALSAPSSLNMKAALALAESSCAHPSKCMSERALRILSLIDVIGIPIYVLLFIWRLEFTARDSWIIFPVWIAASFLLHRDTPKTLGWRADNLWAATKWAFIAFAIMAALLLATGLILGQPRHIPAMLRSPSRLWSYFAFCLLQQVALNSLLNNRFLSLLRREWIAELLTGIVFASCHWPNPVLVPLTFIGGIVFAWLFARHRNILPLAVIQAILGTIAWWSFPVAWHHDLRVGPGFYSYRR